VENKQRDQRKPQKPQKKRKPSHFPGAFFGFGPEPEETKPEPEETKAESAQPKPKTAEKKKRATRKRKRPAAKAPEANAIPKSTDDGNLGRNGQKGW